MYYELTPAYGRDYKTAAEVKRAWLEGQDFEGDYQLGFKPVNINDLPKPATVNLRYRGNTMLAVVKVAVGDKASPQPVASKPRTSKPPSIATMERWLANGVAKALDGCRVEPDGHCEHGKPSWLLQMGII